MILRDLAVFGLPALVLLAVASARADEDFQAAVFQDGNQSLPYRLLRPAACDPQKSYPLVLFLHGAGERGSDNQAQLKHMVRMFAAKESREKYACFVLAPQCPANEKWSDVNWFAATHQQPEKASPSMALAVKLIAELEKKEPIDPRRLYVMGLSMGGYGAWDAVVRYPGMFAAAVPVCGGGDETQAAAIAKLPIWVFHGSADGAVPVARSRHMVEAIRKAGGSPKYTEYPGVGHDSWTSASKEPGLLPWLFAQKRP
jgi:predicted peptidase